MCKGELDRVKGELGQNQQKVGDLEKQINEKNGKIAELVSASGRGTGSDAPRGALAVPCVPRAPGLSVLVTSSWPVSCATNPPVGSFYPAGESGGRAQG